jgi:dihydropteroate synthase
MLCLRIIRLSPQQQKALSTILCDHGIGSRVLGSDLIVSGLTSCYRTCLPSVTGSEDLISVFSELAYILELSQGCGPYVWQIKNKELRLHERTHIMGVLNVTPDSFSDGGEFIELDKAVDHALYMAEAGAEIIDVGGESTRPGAEPVSLREEIDRVLPVIEAMRKQSDIPISIDTCKSEVAKLAVEAGADIINDITALGFDAKIADIASSYGTGLILMHMKGSPRNMQINPHYDDLVEEILQYLAARRNLALENGLANAQIVLDPGIGFGKRWFDNYDIINRLQGFKVLDSPLLVGASRKRFLGKVLSSIPRERTEGSLVSHILAIENGAHIVRVHDVAESKMAAKVADLFLQRRRSEEQIDLEVVNG